MKSGIVLAGTELNTCGSRQKTFLPWLWPSHLQPGPLVASPISFELVASRIHGYAVGSNEQVAAQMALQTAVSFVISLGNREIASFGHQIGRSGTTYQRPQGWWSCWPRNPN
ncbi:hypothetical protein H0G86_004944 [Trichoderma simmonsii]|uniref:Uncharacterized protein n=1 Tax=Trichoderma simmonsii TaxID=1491479 RepID=A0A8G0PFV6_9HYPO|nr:hypothetical protein H0G86_004944 [Trichoderma simmonsii]